MSFESHLIYRLMKIALNPSDCILAFQIEDIFF